MGNLTVDKSSSSMNPANEKKRNWKNPFTTRCVLCSEYQNDCPGRGFRVFPKDPELSDKWAESTKKKWIIKCSPAQRRRYRICDKHFSIDDFILPAGKRLKKTAIPIYSEPALIASIKSVLGQKLAGNSTPAKERFIIRESVFEICNATIKYEIDSFEDPEIGMDVTPPHQPSTSLIFTENPSSIMDVTSSFSRQPITVLTAHHPTITVMSSQSNVYDICIVGAGMFGSAAARHVSAKAGIKICLVGPKEPSTDEMSNREIFGSYYDEGRIVSTLDEDIPSQILSRNSIKRFRELEKLSGIDFYHPVGFLWVSKTNSPLSKKVMQVADAINLPIVDLSYNDIFERRFPYIKLRIDDHPLLDDFGAGYINPRNMVAAQKAVAKNQGCDIIDDVVHEVKPLANGIHEIITENQGVIKAKRVLICTGAFTNFKSFPMSKLQINIWKETAALLKVSFKEAKRLSAMPSVVYGRPEDKFGAYILPPILYPDGYHYIKIGHSDFESPDSQLTSLDEVKNWYLSKGDPKKIEILVKFLVDMLPGLKFEEMTEMTCVTSHNTSELPYIDRVSPTVTIAVVGNGKGAQYSDEVGRIAATLSLTGQWDSELPKSHFQVMYQY